jgi:hypothetical protein
MNIVLIGVERTGSIWLRIETSGGLFRTFELHRLLGNSWVAAQLAATQEWLSSVRVINIYIFTLILKDPKIRQYLFLENCLKTKHIRANTAHIMFTLRFADV